VRIASNSFPARSTRDDSRCTSQLYARVAAAVHARGSSAKLSRKKQDLPLNSTAAAGKWAGKLKGKSSLFLGPRVSCESHVGGGKSCQRPYDTHGKSTCAIAASPYCATTYEVVRASVAERNTPGFCSSDFHAPLFRFETLVVSLSNAEKFGKLFFARPQFGNFFRQAAGDWGLAAVRRPPVVGSKLVVPSPNRR
jgi:hypothetical protein